MKSWKIFLASFLVLILVMATPISIMAAGKDATDTPASSIPRVHLAIVQPWVVQVNQQMQLTVSERLNQTVINGASVYAIPGDKIKDARQALEDLLKKGRAKVTIQDYESILTTNGTLLGQTDGNGKLQYTFNNVANYVLVAITTGYLPGYSWISVREALHINALKKANPGESVTITVDHRGRTDPVTGVNVYAINFANAKSLTGKLASARKEHKGNAAGYGLGFDLKWCGYLSGNYQCQRTGIL